MKIVKNIRTLELTKLTNVALSDLILSGVFKGNFKNSTKGAWKSRQNSIKKQARIDRRVYFAKRHNLIHPNRTPVWVKK